MSEVNHTGNEVSTESIAISIIKAKIEDLNGTIKRYTGDEHIGVRIQAQAKILMLNAIMEDIEHTVKRLS